MWIETAKVCADPIVYSKYHLPFGCAVCLGWGTRKRFASGADAIRLHDTGKLFYHISISKVKNPS